MIDKFALLLPHLLMAIAAWRLFLRADLDRERADVKPARPAKRPGRAA